MMKKIIEFVVCIAFYSVVSFVIKGFQKYLVYSNISIDTNQLCQ